MNNNIEVIRIDHDWSQMKTSNTCFNTSIKELANAPAFHDNVLEYDGRYFAVGEERLEVLDSKGENENFYLLTLVAMAKELEIRGKSEADMVLAVGLPLTRFSAERKDRIEDGDGKYHYEVNKNETMLAREKQNLMKEAFKEWIFKDPERRQKYVAYVSYYNETFNNVRPREYDGSHLQFPGMNPEIELKPHHKNAVARIFMGGNTLLAHCVMVWMKEMV